MAINFCFNLFATNDDYIYLLVCIISKTNTYKDMNFEKNFVIIEAQKVLL